MNNLLKALALIAGLFVAITIPVACDDDVEHASKQYDLTGKVFVNSYYNEGEDYHEAGTEILEFKTHDTVVRHNMFCLLAGDYLQMNDNIENGRYAVSGSTLSILLGDSMETVLITEVRDTVMIHCPVHGKYRLSDLSVEGNILQFERTHKHNRVQSVIEPADSFITVGKEDRFLVRTNGQSYILNFDSVSGSHAANNQYVSFSISGIPGDYFFSEATGAVYLMKFGTAGYVPVDKAMAETSPEDVVLELSCDGRYSDYTLISPTLDKSLKSANVRTLFAKLYKLLY